MTLLTEIGAHLVATQGLVLGSTLVLGQMSEDPDDLVSVHHRVGTADYTIGAPSGTTPHNPNFIVHRFQVVTRKANTPTSYPDCETTANAIWRALSLGEVTLSGIRYQAIEPMNDESPAPLDEDSKGRMRFVSNHLAYRDGV